MDKRGETYHISKELILWIPRSIIMFIVIIIVLAFLGQHVQRQLDIYNIRSNLLADRLFYSPDCFAYQNENGLKPGMIDISKFNELNLNNCIFYTNEINGVGLVLNLTYESTNQVVLINKIVANKFPWLCSDEKNFACNEQKNYVLIKDQTGLKRGVLVINTIESK